MMDCWRFAGSSFPSNALIFWRATGAVYGAGPTILNWALAVAAAASEIELLSLVKALNADAAIDGILVQLPLPKGINAQRLLDLVDPRKDVDGLHPVNAGLLALGRPGALVACTPSGCMRLLALAGRNDIPVFLGRETPLSGNQEFPAEWRKASDELPGITLPEPNRDVEPRSAPDW